MSRTCRSPTCPAMRPACASRPSESCDVRGVGPAEGRSDLLPLAIGAALLGTGGGGNPYIGMLRTARTDAQGRERRVLPLEALLDDAWVGEVGGIGAPVVGVEKIEEGGECCRAMRAVEETAGVKMSALISAEIGGANSMEPIIAAAMAGLPVVDGDGMGRAFPEVQMTTFFIYGAKPAPAAIADEKGNVVVFQDDGRHVLAGAFRPRRRGRHGGRGRLRGRADARRLRPPHRRARHGQPGAAASARPCSTPAPSTRTSSSAIVETTGAKLFFTGKITDIQRELHGGFARGKAIDIRGSATGRARRRASPSRTRTSCSGSTASR